MSASTKLLAHLKRLAWRSPAQQDQQPFRISHRRIYILPTRFGLFVSFALIVLNMGALNYNNNAALLLGFMLVSIGIVSLIRSHLTLLGTSLHSADIAPVFAGQSLLLNISIVRSAQAQTSSLDLKFQSHLQHTELTQLTSTVLWRLPSLQRGWMMLDRIQLRSTHPLGLAKAWAWFNLQQAALIYPQARGQNLAYFQSIQAEHQAQQTRQITDQPHHVRPFRTGDSRRHIAWKLSARTDQLQVREYQQAANPELFFDWSQLHTLSYEQRIEQLCLWLVQAEQKQLRYGLKLPHTEILCNTGAAHLHQCLHALAVMPHE